MDRKPGSGRPVNASTDENVEEAVEMISSQDSQPGTHVPPRAIARELDVSRSTVRRIVQNSEINQFKRLTTPGMDDGARARRSIRSGDLAEKFSNPRMIERAVFQDESNFPLEIPVNRQNNRVYFKGKKTNIPENRLCHQANRQTKNVMVSAALSWHGVTSPFFVNQKSLKVNGDLGKCRVKPPELKLRVKSIIELRPWAQLDLI